MADIEKLREYSERMFRSRYWIEVGCAIAEEDGPVWLRGLAQQLGLPDARVHKPLQQMVSLGLLMPLPTPQGQQAKYYQRTSSIYWELLPKLAAEVEKQTTETGETGTAIR
jgi:hypothetical protein